MDALWEKLCAGGEESRCGWLRNRFGISWQIVPTFLVEMLSDTHTTAAQRTMTAMLQMKKIDIANLERAFRNA